MHDSAWPPARCCATGLIYAGRLAAAGVTVHLREWPGRLHAFVCLTRVIPQGDLALRECADWLTATLAR